MKNKLILAGLGLAVGWLWHKQTPPHPRSIKNAVTIITGGASGIGKATAHSFARQGAIIVIADLQHQLTHALHHEFAPYPTPVHFIACDINRSDDRQQLIREILSNYHQIDILINNAGISIGGEFTELSPEIIDKMIEVNLSATIYLTHDILPIMKQNNRGHIVNVSSINALLPPPGEAIYSATKAGINAFSNSLRRELGQTEINLSVVMPALTQTAMLGNISEEELRQNGLLPAGVSIDRPENVADAILGAVLFNQREVICGGKTITLLARLAQLIPSAMDWAFKHLIDTENFMQVLSKLGKARNSQEQ